LEELFYLLLARWLVLLPATEGAGKSSLIQARLIPRLQDEGFVVYPTVRLRGDAQPGAAAASHAHLPHSAQHPDQPQLRR
jgi:hypothetical protein